MQIKYEHKYKYKQSMANKKTMLQHTI